MAPNPHGRFRSTTLAFLAGASKKIRNDLVHATPKPVEEPQIRVPPPSEHVPMEHLPRFGGNPARDAVRQDAIRWDASTM